MAAGRLTFKQSVKPAYKLPEDITTILTPKQIAYVRSVAAVKPRFNKLSDLTSKQLRRLVGRLGGEIIDTSSVSAVDALAPLAPVLTWDTVSSDTTPNFNVDLPSGNGAPQDAAVNDVLRLEYSSDGVVFNVYLIHVLDAGDIAGDPVTVTGVTPLTPGDYLFRSRLERGVHVSAWSSGVLATVAVTLDDDDFNTWLAAA